MEINWDDYDEIPNEGLPEPWQEGEEGDTWEWELVDQNGLVGKRRKRRS